MISGDDDAGPSVARIFVRLCITACTSTRLRVDEDPTGADAPGARRLPRVSHPPPRRSRVAPAATALGAVAVFAALYQWLVRTPSGRRWDLNPMLVLAPDDLVRDARTVCGPTLYALIGVLAAVVAARAWRRRDVRTPVAVAAATGLALAVAEAAKAVLARPSDPWVHEAATFPSGHAAVLSCVALGAALSAPARTRAVWAGVAVAAMAAGPALLMAGAWHRASDTAGSAALALAAIAVCSPMLPASVRERRGRTRPVLGPAAVAAATAVVVVAVALVTARLTADLGAMTGAGAGPTAWAARGVLTTAAVAALAVVVVCRLLPPPRDA